tara:strand:- start:309 stop:659 length:351 start_codon:yes stop_codon:yes gene_type:complete
MNVKLDCPLCETHNLSYSDGTKQCQHCGYCTTESYKNLNEDSQEYTELFEDIKKHVKWIDNCMWIPSQVQMPNGSISPVDKEGELYYEVMLDNKNVFSCNLFSEAIGYIIQNHYGN